jgi:hypothetical protein
MRKLIVVAVTMLVSLVGVPVVSYAERPPDYFVDPTKLPFDALPGLASQRWWGVHGGAGYRIEVPEHWNGELVVWAHGFAGFGLELTVQNHPLRAYLLSKDTPGRRRVIGVTTTT